MRDYINKEFGYIESKALTELKDKYNNIVDIVVQKSIDGLAKNITIEESNCINKYCMQLRDDVEFISKKIIREVNIPEEKVEIIWAKVRLATGTPKIEVCKEIPISSKEDAKTPVSTSTKPCSHYGKFITVAGVVCEVIGWLLIPGIKAIAAITRVFGIVLIATGAYVIYKEQKQNPRITKNDTAKANTIRTMAEKIADKQFELNARLLSEWLYKVAAALCEECQKELKGE